MPRTHLDQKNVGLARTIYRLRQAIDVYRIIALNADAAKKLGGGKVSGAFFGYVQVVSLEMIAISLCKVFDYENPKKPFKVNSISGVMARLAKHRYTEDQAKAIGRFAAKYGQDQAAGYPTKILQSIVSAFRESNADTLQRLRDFRNQYVAHSQLGRRIKKLPSIDEFEVLFDFASDFYKLVSNGLLNIGPSAFGPHAGSGLLRTLKRLGLNDAAFDFPSPKI